MICSSQTLHCKRRGNDTRADKILALVVGIAGATFAAAELRRIFMAQRGDRGFDQIAYTVRSGTLGSRRHSMCLHSESHIVFGADGVLAEPRPRQGRRG
jgi:hypothetical protein